MPPLVVPTAKALYLCEEVDVEGGMLNLYALLNAMRADAFPYTRRSFACVAQLRGGLGEVPTHIDVRRADDGRLIRNTEVRVLQFPDRLTQLQLVFDIEECRFDSPGLYLVELYCNNNWVTDTTLRLLEARS